MSNAYSEDLRGRIVDAVTSGKAHAVVIARFAVSMASVKRYVARARSGGALAATRHPGKARVILPALHPQRVVVYERL